MDRTGIAPYKAEEKELSEKLFRKLEGLMLIHSPTEEFRKCFTNDMFLKPNQQAFFQTLHYLFRLHDPVEFKRRFYWPLIDKRAESNFRTTSLEYLKNLSEKNNLNWDVKSYLMVMPGGMKFITFLLDLVAFVIQEQIRLREKHLEIQPEEISLQNVDSLKRQNEFFKEYASHYISQVEMQNENFRENIKAIKAIFQNLSLIFAITATSLNELRKYNKSVFEKNVVTQSESIADLTTPCSDLKGGIEKLLNKATELRKDKNGVNQTLRQIFDGIQSPILEEITDDTTTINPLIAGFTVTCPIMQNWLQKVLHNNNATNCDDTKKLIVLKEELEQILTELIDFQKKYSPTANFKSRDGSCLNFPNCSPLSLKYVYTPPLKLKAGENSNARLPLQDDKNAIEKCGNFLTLSGAIPKTVKEQSRDQSSTLNSTLSRSKIFDSSQLLRTIHKESSKKSRNVQSQHRSNLSLLNSKFKDRQQMMFATEKDLSTPIKREITYNSHKLFTNLFEPTQQTNTANLSRTVDEVSVNVKVEQTSTPTRKVQDGQQAGFVVNQSPKTPFNASVGEITRIAYATSIERSPSSLFKKSSIIKKVKDASLNIRNLSTSPSGRLETLVPLEEYEVMILANTKELAKSEKENIDTENLPNLLNMPAKLQLDLSGLNDESIFDTSDTVLKDIY